MMQMRTTIMIDDDDDRRGCQQEDHNNDYDGDNNIKMMVAEALRNSRGLIQLQISIKDDDGQWK